MRYEPLKHVHVLTKQLWFDYRPLIIFSALFTMSLLWTPSLEFGVRYLVQFAMGVLLLILVSEYCREDLNKKTFIKLILVLCLFEVGLAFGEYLEIWRYPISSYSKSANLFQRTFNDDSYSMVPTGFRFNPNNLGLLFSILLPFFYCHRNKWIFALSLPVSFIMIATGSRGVLLGCFLGGFIAFVIGNKLLRIRIIAIIAVIYLAITGLYLQGKFDNTIVAKLRSITSVFQEDGINNIVKSDDSLRIRKALFYKGLYIIRDSWCFGVGAGGSLVKQYDNLDENLQHGTKGTNLHNFWLELVAEAGVIPFLILMYWIGGRLLGLFKNYKLTNDDIRLAIIVAIVTLFVSALAVSTAVYFLPMYMLFGLADRLSKPMK